ncbi:hypothetical protein FNV43_RR07847 [Rhamnella rubrinervis]|uniref:Stigma-specific STIG1-like protein 1 n=1 Tax=Rhamnella rubrinervis TaxID=2594499 RepID=A0A8K0HG11_9ROSA|nr:hypothetical protein FNV43_RR07847 [Rhamnella rubrinervis]
MIKLLTKVVIYTLLATASINVHATLDDHEEATGGATSLRGKSRFLAQQNLAANMNMTCDKFPRVCRLKSSKGPDCCKKKCVNVKSDQLNCGMCGYKCKYTEICCKGNCVNASFDKRNCGGCNNKCQKGEYCVYGMCNYA